MSSLQNQKIKDTYPGLIKTENNGAIGSTEIVLTDGLGNVLPISVSTQSVSFSGSVDLTNADLSGAINSVGPDPVFNLWVGTRAQYDLLSPTYSTTTLYFIK